MTKEKLYGELYKKYGTVTRARNCFLYTKKSSRITDMFQENGRAILGWEGGSAFTHFKNILSRGQVGSFITEDKSRVEKAVSKIFNSERKVFYFSDKNTALNEGLKISSENTFTYTPWNNNTNNINDSDCIIFAPPLPWTDSLYILAVSNNCTNYNVEHTTSVPFAMEAAIARAINNLIQELPLRQEKNWFIYDPILTKYWERKGPYLYSKIPEEKYDDFVMHCLNLGILINPSPVLPSIIPFGADKGVFTVLKNSPFIF